MNSIVNRIFKNKVFNKQKMLKFGFKCINKNYVYVRPIMDKQFELTITVSKSGNIETKLVDCVSNELYTLHIMDEVVGTFVGEVRKAYEEILQLISRECCEVTFFIFPQANRIASLIKDKYNDTPEFLWDKLPGYGVFRNPKSKKWYAIIVPLDKSKLDKNSKGKVEILNIKLAPNEVIQLQEKNGFYPAYHMNKKSWITILLDDIISDKNIMMLIEKSYNFSNK